MTRHRAQRPVHPVFILKALLQDLDRDGAVAENAGERGAGLGQAGVAVPARKPDGWLGCHLRCAQPEIGIASQTKGALTRALRQVAFGQSLQPPGDAPNRNCL